MGKLIVAKGFKSCPKSKKLPDLVTLIASTFLLPEFKIIKQDWLDISK